MVLYLNLKKKDFFNKKKQQSCAKFKEWLQKKGNKSCLISFPLNSILLIGVLGENCA